jgi:hypothetical protein
LLRWLLIARWWLRLRAVQDGVEIRMIRRHLAIRSRMSRGQSA